MITLRLFHGDGSSRQIDERTLQGEEMVIGRGPEADWTIDDPSLSVSRRHCVIGLRDDQLVVIDTSSNGVFVEETRTRLPPREATPIPSGTALRLGAYLLVPERIQAEAPAPEADDSIVPIATRPAPRLSAATERADGALLEAFCAGAGLDVSLFSSVDSAALMREVGEIYRQTVRGLRALMVERSQIKDGFRLEGTTVGARGNNLFRWAPADKVAIDLLRTRDGGFLAGPEAVEASFRDVMDHLTCTLAGMEGAVASILKDLGPDAVEKRIDGPLSLLKNRNSAAWAEYVGLHAELAKRVDDDRDGVLQPRFAAAYEGKRRELSR
jgi:predicted component of type VI protein secretion system